MTLYKYILCGLSTKVYVPTLVPAILVVFIRIHVRVYFVDFCHTYCEHFLWISNGYGSNCHPYSLKLNNLNKLLVF